MSANNSNAELILERVRKTEVLPGKGVQLVGLLSDPDFDPEEVARGIEFDPVMTARVLKMANSAALGAREKIKTVRDAMMRLGSARILAAVMSSGPLPGTKVEGYELDDGQLWESAVWIALASEELAALRGRTQLKEVFTAGLLSTIGKLALGPFIRRRQLKIQSMAFDEGLSFEQAEREVLGVDHGVAGAELLEAWKLPRSITGAVRFHHDPESAGPGHRDTAEIVHVAELLCSMSGIGVGIDGTHYRANRGVVESCGFKSPDLEGVLCRTMMKFVEARSAFGIADR